MSVRSPRRVFGFGSGATAAADLANSWRSSQVVVSAASPGLGHVSSPGLGAGIVSGPGLDSATGSAVASRPASPASYVSVPNEQNQHDREFEDNKAFLLDALNRLENQDALADLPPLGSVDSNGNVISGFNNSIAHGIATGFASTSVMIGRASGGITNVYYGNGIERASTIGDMMNGDSGPSNNLTNGHTNGYPNSSVDRTGD